MSYGSVNTVYVLQNTVCIGPNWVCSKCELTFWNVCLSAKVKRIQFNNFKLNIHFKEILGANLGEGRGDGKDKCHCCIHLSVVSYIPV